MISITDVIVVDWEFSSSRPCERCGKRPVDYWQIAKVRVEIKEVNGKWICLDCLGYIICDMYDGIHDK